MMWIAKILGIDKWIVGAVAVLALLAAIGLGGWWIHSTIYDSGYQAASVKYEAQIAAEHAAAVTARNAEVERQAARQNEAKAREAERIAAMQAEADQLTIQIEELQREASEDPDAGRTAIGAPSVQRINKVR
jgi:5-enolpyruvylshikimate-3-phosphate synthase